MTLLQLYNSVAQLGFEDSLDDGGTIRFLQAANRAMLQVNEIRPRKKLFTLNHIDTARLVSVRADWVDVDEEISFVSDDAKAIYFEACGEGEAKIDIYYQMNVDGVWEDKSMSALEPIIFKTNGFAPFKRIVSFGDKYITEIIKSNNNENKRYIGVRITFRGNNAFTVRNLAMYHTIYSSEDERIPEFGTSIQYDMTKLVPDFLRFGTPLTVVRNGAFLTESNYSIIGGNRLVLPQSGFGAYNVEYIYKPQQFSYTDDITDETQINLDDDLCALLPLLIASYIWLDDEPEKAQYYLNLYTERSFAISNATRANSTLPFISVNGW